MKKVAVAWSGGKDSGLAYCRASDNSELEIEECYTNVSHNGRVSIHGVREEILEEQQAQLGIENRKNRLPQGCNDDEYRQVMINYFRDLEERGVEAIVFADIFETEARRNREKLLEKVELEGIWNL